MDWLGDGRQSSSLIGTQRQVAVKKNTFCIWSMHCFAVELVMLFSGSGAHSIRCCAQFPSHHHRRPSSSPTQSGGNTLIWWCFYIYVQKGWKPPYPRMHIVDPSPRNSLSRCNRGHCPPCWLSCVPVALPSLAASMAQCQHCDTRHSGGQ